MAFVQTTDKWEAAHAFINTWLKDPTYYCNNCGADFLSCCARPHIALKKVTLIAEEGSNERIISFCKNCNAEVSACCDNVQIGTNRDHTAGLIKQNKEMQRTRTRLTASNKDKTMRWGVSLTPRLYNALNKYFLDTIQEKLFENKKQMHEFMRRFKQFCIPERI